MNNCPTHNVPAVHKQGISKQTGKAYDFWTCPQKNDDGSWCSYKPQPSSNGIVANTPDPMARVIAGLTLINDKLDKITEYIGPIDKPEEPKSDIPVIETPTDEQMADIPF